MRLSLLTFALLAASCAPLVVIGESADETEEPAADVPATAPIVEGCDLSAVCGWVVCLAPPRACESGHDCCDDSGNDCASCLPLACGGVCALPVE